MIANSIFFIRACIPIAARFANSFGVQQKCYQLRSIEALSNHIICKRSITSLHHEFNLFRAIEQKRNLTHVSLRSPHRHDDYLKNVSRTFMFGQNKDVPKKRKKRIPKLILLQNPFTWIMIKIDFGILRRVWDPEFQEREFKFGTRQVSILIYFKI